MRTGAKTKIARKGRSGLARLSPRTTKGCAVPFRFGQYPTPIAPKPAVRPSLARALQAASQAASLVDPIRCAFFKKRLQALDGISRRHQPVEIQPVQLGEFALDTRDQTRPNGLQGVAQAAG